MSADQGPLSSDHGSLASAVVYMTCPTYSLPLSRPIASVPSLVRPPWEGRLPACSIGFMLRYSTYFGHWHVRRYIPAEVVKINEYCQHVDQ